MADVADQSPSKRLPTPDEVRGILPRPPAGGWTADSNPDEPMPAAWQQRLRWMIAKPLLRFGWWIAG